MSEPNENKGIQAASDGDKASLLMFWQVGEEKKFDLFEMSLAKSKNGVGTLKKLAHNIVIEHDGSPSFAGITSIGSKVFLVGNLTDEYLGCDRTLLKTLPQASTLVLVVDRQSGSVYEGPRLNSGRSAPHLLTFGSCILAFSRFLWHDGDGFDNPCLEKKPRFELWDTSQPSSKWRPFPHPIFCEPSDDEFFGKVDAYAASSTAAFISFPELQCSYCCDLTYWANLKGRRKRRVGATRGVLPTWVMHKEELPFEGLAYLVDDAACLFAGFGRFEHRVIVCKLQGPTPGPTAYQLLTSYGYPDSPSLGKMFDIDFSITLLPSLAQMCIVYSGRRLKNTDGLCSDTVVVGRFALRHEGDTCAEGAAKWLGSPSASVGVVSNDRRNVPDFELISSNECPEICGWLERRCFMV
ncbi:hypothetical protein DM860_007200 [Cuscuta australis]|uniref:Uncharacterized protein n=1 Tax=Cuscuta australis TaxID=267555 RepID=A0A328E785_9ASTE|nr:hypothetical protein DM860_007200 [Cuscuta australis]